MKWIKLGLMIVIATFLVEGCTLFQPSDGGGRMDNPEANRASKELVEFTWEQTSSDIEECYDLGFYLEDDYPVVKGSFFDTNKNEIVISDEEPWDLTWVIWYDLQNTLDEMELATANTTTTNKITIVWRNDDGTTETKEFDGSNANDLKEKVLTMMNEVSTEHTNN